MDSALTFIKELLLSRLGATGVLLMIVCGLAVYSWYQHHRAKLLQERIDLEAERRKQMADELLAARQVRPAIPAPPKEATLRILVADDEPTILSLCQAMITRRIAGSVVSTSQDGEATLKKISAERPDLVLLDLMMPGKTGYDVLRELKSEGVEIPIIVISGYESSLEGVAKRAGVELKNVRFLSKPFSVDDLIKLIIAEKG